MSYYNPAVLTPFQRIKVQEIGEYDKKGINPLSVVSHDSGGGYGYSVVDIRNYYESIKKPFQFTLRGDRK